MPAPVDWMQWPSAMVMVDGGAVYSIHWRGAVGIKKTATGTSVCNCYVVVFGERRWATGIVC